MTFEPLPSTIPHLAAAAAERRGDALALIEDDIRWTWEQLWRESRAAASSMLDAGVGAGARVAIWAPNSRHWIVAALGAMTCGAAIVPLNTRLKGREAGDILRRTRSCLLVTVDEFLGCDYPSLLAQEQLPDLGRTVRIGTDWDEFVAEGRGPDDPRVDAELAALQPDQISDILFTSGTTGKPKGALSSHAGTLPMFARWAELMGLEEGERYLIINPFFHSFGLKAGWIAAMIAGAVILPVAQFDIPEVIRLIQRHKVNFLPGPPTIYQSLLAAKSKMAIDTRSLRGAATGAASVPPELIVRMRTELGLVDTVTAYGMTECPVITSCRRGDPAELIARSCGKPMPGLEVRIRDNKGKSLEAGQVGEICVRGYGVMLGYLDDPAATAETIDEDGWLHTGDVGTMDANGYLQITDRLKDMYISGGFNVYPAEVESAFAQNESVLTCAIIGVPDDRMGEVGKAFVVLRPDANTGVDDLMLWARANMANYKVPRSIEIVAALPTNASGKVVKGELPR